MWETVTFASHAILNLLCMRRTLLKKKVRTGDINDLDWGDTILISIFMFIFYSALLYKMQIYI